MDISEDSHVLLEQITILSQEFGTSDFVRGGGGNTSVKNETIAWVKPSGTTLSDMTTDTFVALDRQKISGLYQIDTPAEPSQREALVKDVMAEAVISENKARPSVEAPLHDSFDFRFVVHTHPAIVNGMTCAKNGRKICADLFPDSLWIDYIDPGYTLCMVVREKIKDYQKQYSKQPDMVFLENHGVFVAADSAEKIRKLYSNIMSTLKEQYAKAGINTSLKIPPVGDPEKAEKIADQIKRVSG
nr:class II aldolase [Planctomycetota bacterium]